MLVGLKADAIEKAIGKIREDIDALSLLVNEIYKDDMEGINNMQKKEDCLKEIFASNLKRLRKNAGKTQHQLADQAGIHRTLISRYETCRALPREKHLRKIAWALDVPVKKLLNIGR